MTFDQWWDTTKTTATPETFAGWEHSCRQAWNAALAAQADAQPVAPDALRRAFEDECARTDSLLTILGVPPEQCRSEGGSLMPRKVLELMADARTSAKHQSDAPICPWCDRQGHDTCQHADDARTCGAAR